MTSESSGFYSNAVEWLDEDPLKKLKNDVIPGEFMSLEKTNQRYYDDYDDFDGGEECHAGGAVMPTHLTVGAKMEHSAKSARGEEVESEARHLTGALRQFNQPGKEVDDAKALRRASRVLHKRHSLTMQNLNLNLGTSRMDLSTLRAGTSITSAVNPSPMPGQSLSGNPIVPRRLGSFVKATQSMPGGDVLQGLCNEVNNSYNTPPFVTPGPVTPQNSQVPSETNTQKRNEDAGLSPNSCTQAGHMIMSGLIPSKEQIRNISKDAAREQKRDEIFGSMDPSSRRRRQSKLASQI